MTAEPLRVLVVDQGRGLWGSQRYMLRLAPLLRERGIELTLCGPDSLELHSVWRDSGFAVETVPIPVERNVRVDGKPSVHSLARHGKSIAAVARSIAAVARQNNFDALWANGHWVHLDVAIASKLAGIPAVLHLHEEAAPGLAILGRSACVGLADRSVAVSWQVADGLPSWLAQRVLVIPNGVDTTEFSPASPRTGSAVKVIRDEFGFNEGDVMVLALTRLDPVKRIEDLISVMVGLDDPRVRLIIAGTTSGHYGYQRSVIDDARRRAGAAVTFCGWRDDVINLLRACDVFLHAGVVEGMPLGVVEAQACGAPVVAYAAAGVAEAVRDRATALLAPPGDTCALTAALRALTSDSVLRARFGSAARENSVALHSIGLQADRNAEVVRNLSRRVTLSSA